MSIVTFDTYRFIKQAGVTEKQAEAESEQCQID